MSTSPSATPSVMLTIQDPPASPTPSFPMNSPVAVKGTVSWSPAAPGFVNAIRLAIVRASDGAIVTPGGVADMADISNGGFSWSKSFLAERKVSEGLLQVIALDGSLNEVARAERAIEVTAPPVTLSIDRPAARSSFGIDEPIDVAGSATWTAVPPAFSGWEAVPAPVVDSVRVSLLRKPTMDVITSGTAATTDLGVGSLHWEKVVAGDQGLPDALIRASALDEHGNELLRQDIAVAIVVPTVTLNVSSPPASPVASFDVNEPIAVAAAVSWTTGSPGFVKDIVISLVRKADGAVMTSSHATITPEAAGAASAKGTVVARDHLLDAIVRVRAFDKFSHPVAEQDVDIRVP